MGSQTTPSSVLVQKRVGIALIAILVLILIFSSSHSSRDRIRQFNPSSYWQAHANPANTRESTKDSLQSAQDILISSSAITWSSFAYTQYVTDLDYLCNSVMLFQILDKLDSKPDRVLMYPEAFHKNGSSQQARLLRKAESKYGVKLRPVQVVRMPGHDGTWAESFTKLLAFNQTEYSRVLNLDSDSTVLQAMDELFLLPSSPVAMPRAYWNPSAHRQLSSQLMLVEPSAHEFTRIQQAIAAAGPDTYDMEIMNALYYDSCIVLPHRPYTLLTGEFRQRDGNHSLYLGSEEESWDPYAVLQEAKFAHFSDWPVPKPWIKARPEVLGKEKPSCGVDAGMCAEWEIWTAFYEDFARRRWEVCGMELRGSAGGDLMSGASVGENILNDE